MRTLVTGHRGYIGAVLVPVLLEAGHEVVGLDTDYYAGCDFGSEPAPVESLKLDIRDVEASTLAGFDAVVHLAALSNDPVGDLDPATTYAINLDGTLRVAQAARDAGARRFVFASSCSMYGASADDDLLDETAPLHPLTPYAESKVGAEEGLWRLAGEDFSPVAMRNATVYGVSPRLRLDVVLNNLAAWAHTTGRVRLLSDGTAWRPLVHVEDLARVTLALLEAPDSAVAAQAFNVGSASQNYRIRDLADVLAAESGCEIEFGEGAAADPRSYRVDFSKLQSVLPDFRTEWDAGRGARELLAAFSSTGLTPQDFDSSAFVRLRRLNEVRAAGAVSGDFRWRDQETITGAG